MIKRFCDFLAAFVALVGLSPLLLLIAIVVKLDSTGPILFRQLRVGWHQQPFYIHKFRTMRVKQDTTASEITVSDDPRITRVGHFLRRYKLDELAQLIDILVGDMSFVGPRPETPHYVAFYSSKDRKIIFSVRPGLTDWASIIYRDEASLMTSGNNPELVYTNEILPKKILLYRSYVEKQSFFGDLRILMCTFYAIAS
jgi:lipopolysaccharide/colanic/teichoic acid biosynthesis glycosyltransferase